MGMPATISGDPSLGHAFSPSALTPTQATVVIGVHVLGTSAHAGTIAQASTTVFANSKGVARIMDTGDCGAMILGTAGNVLIGG